MDEGFEFFIHIPTTLPYFFTEWFLYHFLTKKFFLHIITLKPHYTTLICIETYIKYTPEKLERTLQRRCRLLNRMEVHTKWINYFGEFLMEWNIDGRFLKQPN
jgi:hypothetical protein